MKKYRLAKSSGRCLNVEIRGQTMFYPIGKVCQKPNGRWDFSAVSASTSRRGDHKTAALAAKGTIREYKSWIGR